MTVRCNACGIERLDEHGEGDMHALMITGGYGDTFPEDLMRITFVACSDCLKAWTSTFKVPPHTSDLTRKW